MSKQFRNAMCGLPKDHKNWQDWYEENNLEEVYNYWKNLAEEEKCNNPQRVFWRVIIEIIEYKSSQKSQLNQIKKEEK